MLDALEALGGGGMGAGDVGDVSSGSDVSGDDGARGGAEVVSGDVVPVGVEDVGAVGVLVAPVPAGVEESRMVAAAEVESRNVDDAFLDQAAFDVAIHCLIKKERLETTISEAHTIGLDKKQLREIRTATADACWHLERTMWSLFVKRLGEAPAPNRLIAYVNYGTYDGVDLKTVARAFFAKLARSPPALLDEHDASHVLALAKGIAESAVSADKGETSYGYTKVQHSGQKVGIAMEAHGEIRYIVAHLSSLLLAVDRNTAECILGAILRQQSPCLEHSGAFPRRVRVSESDGADYNPRAEKGYKPFLAGFAFLRVSCEIHFDAGTFGKVYGSSSVKPDVTGMLQTSLALNSFGMMIPFRAAVRRALSRMLHIVPFCDVDEDGQRFKALVLDTFLDSSAKSQVKRATILRLCPGDWRTPGVFEWVLLGAENKDDVLDLLETGLTPTLFSVAPYEFPRNRWTGCEVTYEHLGLPTNINNLELEVFREFRAWLGEPPDAPSFMMTAAAAPCLLRRACHCKDTP